MTPEQRARIEDDILRSGCVLDDHDIDALRALLAAHDEEKDAHMEAANVAKAALAAMAAERDALQRAQSASAALLSRVAPWTCPDCGPHIKVAEDGTCAACGADASLSARAADEDQVVALEARLVAAEDALSRAQAVARDEVMMRLEQSLAAMTAERDAAREKHKAATANWMAAEKLAAGWVDKCEAAEQALAEVRGALEKALAALWDDDVKTAVGVLTAVVLR